MDRVLTIKSYFSCERQIPNRRGSRNFRQGGVQTFRNFWQAKKKKHTHTHTYEKGKGGFSIYCFSMIEIYFCHRNSFTDNTFSKYDIPRFFLHVKHIRDDCFSFVKCASDVTRGGGMEKEKFWLKWCKIV